MSVQEYGSQPRIVAGVDGSDSSLSALRWAVRQAGMTGAAVDAVAAWHYPVAAGGFGYVPMGTGEDYDFKEITEKAPSGRTSFWPASAISGMGRPSWRSSIPALRSLAPTTWTSGISRSEERRVGK